MNERSEIHALTRIVTPRPPFSFFWSISLQYNGWSVYLILTDSDRTFLQLPDLVSTNFEGRFPQV